MTNTVRRQLKLSVKYSYFHVTDIIFYNFQTTNILSRLTLSVIMNNETPWTLKPWHVSASFRKCSYIVPEETITLPSKPIIGPNPEIQNKTFFITVTVSVEKIRIVALNI